MKIAEYNEMMAYLTRPEPLPQPKPQELLDIQEENRKGRLLDSLNKICLLYTSPSPRDRQKSRMPSSA